MSPHSAGLLLYRMRDDTKEVLLAHPGGPFWRHRDNASWSIPKGLVEPGEPPLRAARREFAEEIGTLPEGEMFNLGTFVLTGGKRLSVWTMKGDLDPGRLRSNLFKLEWPPHSGRIQHFAEIDRIDWFKQKDALTKITRGQKPVLDTFFACRPKHVLAEPSR